MSAAPDYIEPTVGWRVWRVADAGSGARLLSVAYDVPWPPRSELVAECFRRPRVRLRLRRARACDHAAPRERCTCGIYAAGRPEGLAHYLDDDGWEQHTRWPLVHRVIGRVFLCGQVIECEHGFRASHAYPAHLYLPRRDGHDRPLRRLNKIASALGEYGVPVEFLDAGRGEELTTALAASAVV